jgi:hypothetical protein
MNDNIKNIELVKKSYEELQDEVIKLTTDKFILQSNWNSLREWLMQLKNSYMETDNIFDDAKFRILLSILDKMNELEGKYDDN